MNDFYMLQDMDRWITEEYAENEYDHWRDELEEYEEDEE